MNFLLDTNVISETSKPTPNEGVIRWLAEVDEDRMFLSVATLAELRYGIEGLPGGRRRSQLEQWLEIELTDRFAPRILDIDIKIADAWGSLLASSMSEGRPVGVMDCFLAATALANGMTLVTRDESDFISARVAVLNPWKI